MPRHRGVYKPDNAAPYELSRSAIEKMVQCEACFWLEKVKGVKTPSIPSFNLNSNTDILLKKDFDAYRGVGPHPLMEAFGLGHLRPFQHPSLALWTDSLHFGAEGRFHYDDPETNIRFGGGVDDVWENPETGELHIVDYKSTAQLGNEPKPLDETFLAPPSDPTAKDFKAGYRRQMDMYQWVARRLGFTVSDTGYFVYVDGQHRNETGMLDIDDPTVAWMRFDVAVIPYIGNDRWVSKALAQAKRLVEEVEECPTHSPNCEYGSYVDGVEAAGGLPKRSVHSSPRWKA
jgi:hypothetical protein